MSIVFIKLSALHSNYLCFAKSFKINTYLTQLDLELFIIQVTQYNSMIRISVLIYINVRQG